jgi:hypothetical protein
MPHPEAPLPTPEEEIETVLPADVLASLDEPIESDEDEEPDGRGLGGPDRDGMGAHAKGTTAGGPKHTTATGRASSPSRAETSRELTPNRPSSEVRVHTGSPLPVAPHVARGANMPDVSAPQASLGDPQTLSINDPYSPSMGESRTVNIDAVDIGDVITAGRHPPPLAQPHRTLDTAPIAIAGSPTGSMSTLDSATVALQSADDLQAYDGRPPAADSSTVAIVGPLSMSDVPTVHAPLDLPARAPTAGVVVKNPIDARRFIADAITHRLSGALCFEHARVVRRLVLRDGDLVTAASGAEPESLVCFLGARGDLPRDEVDRLAGKVPPYGRHAGAALVAHGWLGQDQLWSTLRSHAEWIAACLLRLGGGTAQLELEPPGRLRSEPSVFAASTGAEIFVELVRRAVSPAEAIEALGGEGSRIGDGPARALLSECALPPTDLELVSRSRGSTLGDLLGRAVEPDIAAVVHALALLGVLDVLAPTVPPRTMSARSAPSQATQTVDLEASALDEEAVRARIRARLELVDEGDYFAVLGVSRDATSYEVRRAFVELRRAFEPSRILSPSLSDLADDVRKIVIVLEEAYEILRDVARRERYRRAIDGQPS